MLKANELRKLEEHTGPNMEKILDSMGRAVKHAEQSDATEIRKALIEVSTRCMLLATLNLASIPGPN